MRVVCAILLTNDDGVGSESLPYILEELIKRGHDVVAVLPDRDMSGSGTSIATKRRGSQRVRYTRTRISDFRQVPVYVLNETPATCVMCAYREAFDFVADVTLAAINRGLNAGPRILYSGTVGAALTAAAYGGRAAAVSQDRGTPQRWGAAADVAAESCDWLTRQEARTVVNVNLPNRELSAVEGVRMASVAPASTGRASMYHVRPRTLGMRFEASGYVLPAACDTILLAKGFVTVTALPSLTGTVDLRATRTLVERLAVKYGFT